VKNSLQKIKPYIWIIIFGLFAVLSYILQFSAGKVIFSNFRISLVEMLTFVPFIFIIVGLFDVWVPREKIEKHIGDKSGIKGVVIMVLLAMLQAGPLYAAFPVTYILYKKGASIRNILIFLGAYTSVKIPMLGLEIGYLGIRFTLMRSLVSLPLFIAIGFLMERYLKNRDFRVNDLGKVK